MHPFTAAVLVSPEGCCLRHPSGPSSYSASHFWPIFCWISGSLASSLTSQVSVNFFHLAISIVHLLCGWLRSIDRLNGEGSSRLPLSHHHSPR